MKKAAALIITICLILVSASPLVVSAAAVDFEWFFTKEANQNLSIFQDVNNQNFYGQLLDESDLDAVKAALASADLQFNNYAVVRNGGGSSAAGFANHLFIVDFDDDAVNVVYCGSEHQGDLRNQGANVNLSNLPWTPYMTFSLKENGVDHVNCFTWDGSTWVKESIHYNQYWNCLSYSGDIICTNYRQLYNGGEIGYYMYHDDIGFLDAVLKSENHIDMFNVWNGSETKGYDEAFPEADIDFTQDNSLSLSSIDMIPLKDNYIGGMTATKVKGAFNFNTFDTTFGGDTVKENAAKSSYGLQFDVTVNYNVDCSYDKAAYQALFGESYSGSIHSTFYIDGMTEAEAQKFEVSVTLMDLLSNSDSIVTGSNQGATLLSLIAVANNNGRGSSTADFLGFGGGFLDDEPIVEEVAQTVPIVGDAVVNVGDWLTADYTYGLTELYYYADVTPYNDAVGIKGVMSDCECDLISGVHSGTAGGGYRTDPITGEVVKNPDYKTGPDQNYLMPTILPGGGSGEIVVSGSPSNSSANAQGGVANVNVQANPIITFDNGLDTFMQVMNLSKNAETVQKGFWGFFGMFKDNPASELYREYFGDIPADFMKFLLACSGICFGLGVFRFVRGRYL